ncbi:zinc finger protein 106 [Notolabrus celidotus]|uniref:zinc finger protein 106 n=1 Tax=Notolabrus celidotus TaxID=1203425 RepID=UPI00148F5A03|nr:zinc finger protein 106 [Notolabrus celidotus]XP_034530890.1 zinc finger protein 106 [Notolabrus celidotus]
MSKMARDRKCILCETVHISKQEMDEHMRSMLHHRELEKLKGRDCGHECRVCKVTVASLTDYAGHISSPSHKQNVEAAEKGHSGNAREEDYFDRALVQLVEKRKEQIRKEKEAAAAKLSKEEEERKRNEELQQKLKEAKERYQRGVAWQQQQKQQQQKQQKQPSQGFSGTSHNRTWYRSNQFNDRAGEQEAWNHNRQGKSATWHAQEPPNFQRWASEEFTPGSFSNQEHFGNRQLNQGQFQQNRLPWLSNGGSSNGIYGRNNISQFPQRNRPVSLFESPLYPPPPFLFAQPVNQFQNTGNPQGGQTRVQNGEGRPAEPEHNRTSKTFGSNPKLDKTARWSPYPVSKGFESAPHKDSNSLEKHPTVPKPQTQDKAPDTSAANRQSRPEQKLGQLPLSSPSPREKVKKIKPQSKSRDGSSSSSSRSSSTQRDEHLDSAAGPPSDKNTNKPVLQKDRKASSFLGLNVGKKTSKPSSQAPPQTKSTTSQSRPGSTAPAVGPLQSKKERQLPETFCKAKQTVLERRSSLDNSKINRFEMVLQISKEQQRDQSHIGMNKENSCRQNAAKPNVPESLRPEKPGVQPSDSSQFLQSLHVSTSTLESLEPAASSREGEENRKKERKEACQEEAMQAVEAGQSSESDTSRSGEAQQTVSGSNTSSLSKLDLPPVLKRDLSKHISSKSKAGCLEPNLNIARRVRNVSESRRSDTEKDSGLKPTVRQLISSSSRRNVNWEQVYQEVRKKQDKGKGMPRFGIEMVPCEQEDQSQEEGDVPLLEGFQWDSLMDSSAPGSSRKRSLSESSIAPASSHSLFASLTSQETQRDDLRSEPQVSPVSTRPQEEEEEDKDSLRHLEVEKMLGQLEEKAQKQPEKLTSVTVKALQRSDSVLGDSSSGTEQLDGQGTGKRRRAAGDVPSAETSCLEHNNKRRKVKSKKERLQIDQLLAVSLREEELSRSLQTVDTSLIQARAALQAAYMEVQRLMVVKQQMNGEMNTLRNKRIELLKGMQGTMDEAPKVTLKEERMDPVQAVPSLPTCASPLSVTDPAVAAGTQSPGPPAERASPPSSSWPVVIKQEPQSPVHVSSDPDPVEHISLCAHSTTPELPVAPAAASPSDSPLHFQPSPERNPEQNQINTENDVESFLESADHKEGLSGLVETVEKATQATKSFVALSSDSKSSIKRLSPSRRGSEVGSVGDCATSHSFEPPSVLNLPASPSELRGGKRVRKLKKRKVLKKAQGAEQPESSDTELDGETLRPKFLRPRRRPSGSSQVSTSTLPVEDREGDVNMEAGEDMKVDLRSPKHTLELPPAELMINSDSDLMEVSLDPLIQTPTPALVSSRVRPQSLACNEVSSTSDMEICKSSESDLPFPTVLPKTLKTSSDASSDHGEDDLPTEGVFEGHQEAVNAMQIHNGLLYTCSGDRTVRAFDLVSHKCVGVFEGHSSKVSCLLVSAAPSLHHRLYTGSSDQTIRCYSLKTNELEQQFSLSDRVLCLHSRWKYLYAGLANGTVVTFNLKTNKETEVFECHGPRAVSCLASSQEGARRILLVGSYDSTISVRDAKNGLLLRTLEGHTKTVLCMKVVNDLVFSGSSDQCVYAHNIHTGELVRVYKGHSHAVTVVSVLGKVMVTACLDKLVRVYDLQSHEQLQVYAGHRDMVMCMAIHKSMIYTGCYDGSVQAVKLNLMQNYRCRWHGCSLVFGMTEHLQQHLINDHTSANVQTLKCRWKSCEEFFCSRNSSKQAMLMHMQKHAEEETEAEP